MKMREIDVAIIGAGTAGMYALSRALRKTDNVLIFDGGELGTTCARVGCMPSKMLIHSADNAVAARSPEIAGENIRVDDAEMMRSLRKRRDMLADEVRNRLQNRFRERLIPSDVSFAGPMKLEADGSLFHCRAIVIACGTTPALPPGWRTAGQTIVTTDQLFELETIPETVLVIGLGFVGVEIGQALSRLGRSVTAVEMTENIAGIGDPEVRSVFASVLEKSIDLRRGATAVLEKAGDGGVTVGFSDREGKKEFRTFELAVVAAGRKPDFARLRLEKSGLSLNERGFPLLNRQTLKCGDRNVFLAGDCSLIRPFYQDAVDQGRCAGENAADPDHLRPLPARVPLAITFTRPCLCSVGRRFDELDQGAVVAGTGFENSGRRIVDEASDGILRMYADGADGRIIGAEMAAPAGEHLAHLIAVLIQARMTVEDALRLPFYHPTYEESVRDCLRALRRKSRGKG